MAKIYFNKYSQMIDNGEITLEQAIALVNEEVPTKWRQQVIDMLNEAYPNQVKVFFNRVSVTIKNGSYKTEKGIFNIVKTKIGSAWI